MEEPNNTLVEVQQLLELDPQKLETLDQCSDALAGLSEAADQWASKSVSAGKWAIQYAVKAGHVLNRAKEICPHGEFLAWLQLQSEKIGRGLVTLRYWMKAAANVQKNEHLMDSPDIKSVSDLYRAVGILPEPEPKPTTEGGTGESDKVKLAWSPIKFSTRIDDWTKEQALDWLYEYDRMGQWARQLRMEFGLT